MTERSSDRATPKFHGDDGSVRINALRREFEDWYVGAAFDYTANPIGSHNCDLQWRAWLASRLAASPDGAQAVYQARAAGELRWAEVSYDGYRAAQAMQSFEARILYTAPPSQDAEDAARYRWLRDRADGDLACGLRALSGPYFNSSINGERLDAAIDAARAARGGG